VTGDVLRLQAGQARPDDPRLHLLIRHGGSFLPEPIARASGSWLETTAGRKLPDFTSVRICATIGHNHPRIVEASQAGGGRSNASQLVDGFRGGTRLADGLVELVPPPLARAMILSTGAEANEAALRLARLVSGGSRWSR
jgi:2,2-dialkylglycine decarboxylase (pyruvate)